MLKTIPFIKYIPPFVNFSFTLLSVSSNIEYCLKTIQIV